MIETKYERALHLWRGLKGVVEQEDYDADVCLAVVAALYLELAARTIDHTGQDNGADGHIDPMVHLAKAIKYQEEHEQFHLQ